MNIINIEHISKIFGEKVIFEDASFGIQQGDKIGIVGINGTGKSTLLRMIAGEEEPDQGQIIRQNGLKIAYLSQNPHFPKGATVASYVLSGNGDKDWLVQSNMTKLGIEVSEQEVENLSGGQRRKLALAKVLAGDFDVLLLDEPTNHLDLQAIEWLEEFLINFDNTVIVVSHDRYFLNKVCTQTADIDYGKIKLYVGNYDFWYESSELLQKQMKESNKKKEEKIKELQAFIARFSANASKSKQATSRKKLLDKIQLDEIVPSSRKYPYIDFKIEKEAGKEILKVENLTKIIDGKTILDHVSFTILKGDKITFLAQDDFVKTTLFNILAGKEEYDEGTIEWGKTIKYGYLPQDNTEYFDTDKNIMEWIGQYYDVKDETVLRGFLGRMLFSGEDVFKKVSVLSGGEKARCMLSKMMLEEPNFLILDEPTNHLDLESITSLNKGMTNFKGEILFTSRDYELNSTVANRVIEILEDGKIIDRAIPYEEYLERK